MGSNPIVGLVVVRIIATIAIAMLLAGCGHSSHSNRQQATVDVSRLSAWSDAAVAYGTIVGQCARQPNPARGYWDACTRDYRESYQRATHAVLVAVRACPAASALPELIRAETAALASESRWNQTLLDDVDSRKTYTGPNLIAVRTRSLQITDRASHTADRLAARIKQHGC